MSDVKNVPTGFAPHPLSPGCPGSEFFSLWLWIIEYWRINHTIICIVINDNLRCRICNASLSPHLVASLLLSLQVSLDLYLYLYLYLYLFLYLLIAHFTLVSLQLLSCLQDWCFGRLNIKFNSNLVNRITLQDEDHCHNLEEVNYFIKFFILSTHYILISIYFFYF